MKRLSEFVRTQMMDDYFSTFVLFEIGPSSSGEYLRGTSLNDDYTFGGNVFNKCLPLRSIDAPRISETVDKENFKISIADPDFAYRVAFEDGLYKAKLSVWVGFVGDNGEMPEEGISLIYRGAIGSYSYSITQDNEVLCILEGESPMGSMQLSRSIITSKEYLRQVAPNDSSFDQIYVGSKSTTLKWGKA